MSSHKTNGNLFITKAVAESKLTEFVENTAQVGWILEDLKYEIEKEPFKGFFKNKEKDRCRREIDCNIKDEDQNGYRYIGEAASSKDLKSNAKYSTSHIAVKRAIEKKGKKNGEIIYIIQKIMCQILPAYLFYNLEIKDTNIKCFYGSAEKHKDNKGQYNENIGNIAKAIELMKCQGWIKSADKVEYDLKSYGLLIYEIEFCISLIRRFNDYYKAEPSKKLEEDFYVEYHIGIANST